MSIFSTLFFVMVLAGVVFYYIVPCKYQWIVLLGISSVFYASQGIKGLFFVLFSSILVYVASLYFDKKRYLVSKQLKEIDRVEKEKRKEIKLRAEKEIRTVLIISIIINLGCLVSLKYILPELSTILLDSSSLILPLGISYYTLTTTGYLMDVYWEKVDCERNFLRLFLFVSYFPSIIQGPINRYNDLGAKLTAPHKFDLRILEKALVLILYGFFKKFVIANRLKEVVYYIFDNPDKVSGLTILFGLVMYSIWLYADFSGGIDIISGISEAFGVELPKNFLRPYFSSSLPEFWRRWHITLGAWMKDYIMVPLVLSKASKTIRKKLEINVSSELAGAIVIGVNDILVFFLVGLWHGVGFHYVIWGLYNGVVLFAYALVDYKNTGRIMTPLKKLVSILFTFAIINIGWIFDIQESVHGILEMLKGILFRLYSAVPFADQIEAVNLARWDWSVLLISVIILFIVSVLEERALDLRNWLFEISLPIRWLLLYSFLFFSIYAATGFETGADFFYANF